MSIKIKQIIVDSNFDLKKFKIKNLYNDVVLDNIDNLDAVNYETLKRVVSGATSGITTSLSELEDVSLNNLENYDILTYSGNTWINKKNYFSENFYGNINTIEHNLGRIPDVIILNNEQYEIFGEIKHIDNKKFILKFNNYEDNGIVICKI